MHMPGDRVPIPIQAILATLVPALSAAASVVAWALVTWSEPQGTLRTGLMVIPLSVILVGSFIQHRVIRRARLVGMIDPPASPLLVAVLTAFGAVIGIVSMAFVEDGPAGLRTPWNRNSVGFSGFLAVAAIWLSAYAALVVSRRRAPE
jgi:hypothetical protein